MNDRVALVPGGAGNLGRAVTREFLAAGAYVAVPFYKADPHHSFAELRAQYGERLFTFALDLTTERGAQECVREVLEWKGRIDAVAHMVGGYFGGVGLVETPLEEWDRMMDLNLKSAWLVARAAIPRMAESGGGALVFVSSRAARSERAGQAVYAVAKAGVLTLAEAIAEEYREQGIRANVVLPGTVDTEDNRRALPDADFRRWTPPEQIARVVLFLASGAGAAINGAAVPVYGVS